MIWLGWIAMAVLAVLVVVGAICLFVDLPGDWEDDE